MRNIAILIVSAALAAAPGCAASASDVEGRWETVTSSAQGDFPATIIFTETDDGYAVEIDDGGMFGASDISEIEVEENSFSFIRTLDFGQGPLDVSYSGTIEGDTLTGEVNSDFGPGPIRGTRQ